MTRLQRIWGRDGTPCGYCGKGSFPSERAATNALRARYRGNRTELHVYRCGSGGVGWHYGHIPRAHEWPGWDDAATEQACDRCPIIIRAGEPVATLRSFTLCFDCGDLAEQAAIGKAAS